MVQSPSWAADWFAASQEIPRISRNPKIHLRHSQASATCLYPGPAQSSPHAHIPLNSKLWILYIYSTNIGTEYFKHGIYSSFLFLTQYCAGDKMEKNEMGWACGVYRWGEGSV